jgi:hypothetical protein
MAEHIFFFFFSFARKTFDIVVANIIYIFLIEIKNEK